MTTNFQRQWNAAKGSESRRSDFLKTQIARANAFLLSCGPPGKSLLEGFRAAGTIETIDNPASLPDGSTPPACFNTFRNSGFANEMTYDLNSATDFPSFFEIRVHEMVHAIQYNSFPILHASITNPFSPVSCRRHEHARIENITEMTAHAVQAYMSGMLALKEPKAYSDPNVAARITKRTRTFQKQYNNDTSVILNELALMIRRDYGEFYSFKARSDFYRSAELRNRHGLPPLFFIKPTEQEIYDLGNMFIGGHLRKGIEPDHGADTACNETPSLETYLAANNLTPIEFMEQSRNQPPIVPPTGSNPVPSPS